jgi:hypothetical protein
MFKWLGLIILIALPFALAYEARRISKILENAFDVFEDEAPDDFVGDYSAHLTFDKVGRSFSLGELFIEMPPNFERNHVDLTGLQTEISLDEPKPSWWWRWRNRKLVADMVADLRDRIDAEAFRVMSEGRG